MTGQLLTLRRDQDQDTWLTVDRFCSEIGSIAGRTPSTRWARYKIAEGMPSGKFFGRRMIPRERGIAWLRERGFVP